MAAHSPRPRLRVDERETSGAWSHGYTTEAAVADGEPAGPYAMYLADRRRRFRALCFDLDGTPATVQTDLAVLRRWLADAGLTGIEAASGGAGRRHVWITLAGPVSAELVAEIAQAAKRQLPTLDTSPLMNPKAGCVRPPGAPHRHGGRSTVQAPDLEAAQRLWAAGQDPAGVERLAAIISAEAPVLHPAVQARRVDTAADGQPWIPGGHRPLSPDIQAAVDRPVEARENGSARLASILVHAALAHWTLTQVRQLLPTAGLLHARERKDKAGRRRPRPADKAEELLIRQWARAVTYASCLPSGVGAGDDPEFIARAAAVVGPVQAAQHRADAAVGRWARPGGAIARRILDAHHLVALQAVTTTFDLSGRRAAELAGCSEAQARRARHQLAAEGWLTQVGDAAGPLASRWQIPTAEPSTTQIPVDDAQAGNPRPRPTSPALDNRTAWLNTLTRKLEVTSHPTFTPQPHGLGGAAGLVLHHLLNPCPTPDLPIRTGHSDALRLVHRLVDHGLVDHTPAGWHASSDRLDQVAVQLGVDDVPIRRAQRHARERLLWHWWCDELGWMRLPRKDKQRRGAVGQLALPIGGLTVRGRLGPLPRDHRSRVDWEAAQAILDARQDHVAETVAAA